MKNQLKIVLSGLSVLVAAFAFADTHSENITQAEDLMVFVGSNASETYSGNITLTGGGALHLSGNNSFDGGLEIQNGQVYVENEFALGTQPVSFTGATKQQLFFCVADATFSNPINITDSRREWNSYDLYATENTTLSGDITSACGLYVDAYATQGRTFTFTGAVRLGDTALYTSQSSGSRIIFEGPICCGQWQCARSGWGDKGQIYLRNSGNVIRQVYMRGTRVNVEAAGALDGAELFCFWRWASDSPSGYIFSGDITIPCLDALLPEDGGQPFMEHSADYGGFIRSSDPESPRILTITGGVTCAGSTTAYCRNYLDNGVQLVIDAPGFTQVFMERGPKQYSGTGYAHHTDQPILVRNGTMRLTDTVNFYLVPALSIEEGGAVECAVTNEVAFSGVRFLEVKGRLTVEEGSVMPFVANGVDFELDIGSDAEIWLPAGTRLEVCSLMLDGESYLPGFYGPGGELSQLKSGEIVITSDEPGTWTGAGSDDLLLNVENWGGGIRPDLYSGLAPMVVVGGNRASWDFAAAVQSLNMQNEDGSFRFAADGPAAAFKIAGLVDPDGKEPLTFSEKPDVTVTNRYEFEMPVTIVNRDRKSLTVQENDVLSFDGGLTIAAGQLDKYGPGLLELGDGTELGEALYIEGGSLKLKGLIATPGHVDQGTGSRWDQYKSIICGYQDGNLGHTLYLENATVEKLVFGKNASGLILVDTNPNATNTFVGHFSTGTPAQNLYVRGEDGVLRFKGGYSDSWSSSFHGGGTVEFYDYPTRTNTFRSLNACSSKVVFKGVKNLFGDLLTFNFYNNGVITFEQDYATLEPIPGIYFGYLYGNGNYTNTVDLAGTTQWVDRIAQKTDAGTGALVTQRSAFVGGAGSTLEIHKGGTNAVYVGGAVSFRMVGEGGYLLICQKTSSTTGTLGVEAGTVEFSDGARWVNATGVAVGGSGRLVLNEDHSFGRTARLTLSGNGVLDVRGDSAQRFVSVSAEGTEIRPGTYTYATAPSELKAHLEPGMSGTIIVSGGFVMYVR